jgi:hypothetical protein
MPLSINQIKLEFFFDFLPPAAIKGVEEGTLFGCLLKSMTLVANIAIEKSCQTMNALTDASSRCD